MRPHCIAIVIALSSVASTALADPPECGDPTQRAQAARTAGKLVEAHQDLQACAADCCAALANEVRAATPTIVIDAKDDAGHDIGDATVAIDGVTAAEHVDGRAIALDPGAHTITVVHNGSTRSENLIAKEGEKSRLVRVVFARPADPANVPMHDGSGHTIAPWALVGAGAAVVIAGIVLVATTPTLPSNCNDDTGKCTQLPSETAQQLTTDRTTAGNHDGMITVGACTIVVGTSLVVGGLIWHFLEKTKPRTAMIAPWLASGSGGISAAGSF